MRIVTLADIHGHTPTVPECDLCLIAGDICPRGNLGQQTEWLGDRFRMWLQNIPAKYVVGCAGNHDFPFVEKKEQIAQMGLRWHYLEDSGTNIHDLAIWGSPWQRRYYDWAFNLSEAELSQKWSLIPPKTDILVVHSPPYGYGDQDARYQHLGSPSLLERIGEIKPKLVVCGHIHPGRGVYPYKGTAIVNAAICTIQGMDYVQKHEPFVFDLNDELVLV